MATIPVVIRKVVGKPERCRATDFLAKRGDTVMFVFPGVPIAQILFNGNSPFDEETFDLVPDPADPRHGFAEKQVSQNAKGGKLDPEYRITWTGGSGNGGGEVQV